MGWRPDLRFPGTELSHSLCDGYAERGEAVQHGDLDVELRDLAVEIPRSEALARQFDAVHPGLCAAPAVIAAPSSPDRPTEAP